MTNVNKAINSTTAPLGFKTLVVEDGGRSLKCDITKSNPFPVLTVCERPDCMMCTFEPSKGKCWGSNAVYKIECTRAPCTNEGGTLATYIGETCRSYYTRGSQHLNLYKNKKDNSRLWKHCKEEHGGLIEGETDFRMKPVEKFRDPITRILHEAVRIQQNEVDPKTLNLNSKMEYFGPEYVRPNFSKGPVDQW